MKEIFVFCENLISGMLPFAFLIICGVYLTAKSGFFQFKFLPLAVKHAFGGMFTRKKDGISTFQAACTALSSTVGTGNIAGVAGAIALGGAGAVFWMWLSALAGMVVKSAEIILSLKFKEKNCGGPMYYIKKGLSDSFLPIAVIFSFAGIFSAFFSGNITQTGSAIAALNAGNGVRLMLGVVFALAVAAVIIGGAKRIGSFTEKVVPIMALMYIIMTLGVILMNINALPNALVMIFKGAFEPQAVTGGTVGSVMTVAVTGASRGVFSNEAGLGTSAMAHASAEENEGAKQSLYGIFEVFADTLVICTLTALTILTSGVNIEYGKAASTELAAGALSSVYGKVGIILLSVMMCLFGLSSVIGWGLYGVSCSGYLFGKSGERIFTVIYPLFCVVGALCKIDIAWRLSAFFNGIMLCINVFAVLMLSNTAIQEMRKMNDKSKN
ncbi:MAG: amino acid carrier protein [Acutalibacteraceae bacterium]|nr:amino acid carrier protein [Acutalibacteraceae bacterium]